MSECANVSFAGLGADVKINKMPGTSALCRKDRLCTNYRWLQEQLGEKLFSFLPETYNIPDDWAVLKQKMQEQGSVWITKPPASSCGNGIKLVTDPAQIPERRTKLSVQRYIANPCLINGLKFDLRLYVLVTSMDPIKIYLYQDGLVRFATKPYSSNEEHFGDKFMHLTNYSVNKGSEDFEFNEAPSDFSGHKWSLKTLWKYLECEGFDHLKVVEEIKIVVIKTILCGHYDILEAVGKELTSEYNSYKLFGVDIMLDEHLKPWLLELNDFPSLEPPTLDRYVNEPMIAEMFNIVGFHITEKLNKKTKKILAEKYDLKDAVQFDPKLYTMEKTFMQQKKEEYYTGEKMTRQQYLLLRQQENLTGRDVRILMKAEEEFAETVNFTRLFPRKDSYKFLDYVEIQSYNDRLLESWENAYGDKRSSGLKLLARLCSKGVHLEDL